MPFKGMGSVFYNQAPPAPAAVQAFRETLMEDNIESAKRIISRWDPEGGSEYAKITSLFHESRDEAAKFIQAVHDIHQAMLFFSSYATQASSHTAVLVRAQGLMQIAMNRLQKEFYQMLMANREAFMDYDNSVHSSARSSLSDADEIDIFRGGSVASSLSATDDEGDDASGPDVSPAGAYTRSSEQQRPLMPSAVTADLRSIAHCMISTGYAYECLEVYKRVRTSVVHDGLARLGFELSAASTNPKSQQQNNKKSSNNSASRDNDDQLALEGRVTAWVAAAPVAVRTIFAGELLLSDIVFGNNGSGNPTVPINESSFAFVVADAAVTFFAFPDTIAARILKARSSSSSSKRARLQPDGIFGLLDMYDTTANLWPVIESLFSSASTSRVQKQVHISLAKLSEAVRSMIDDLELAIQKDASKTIVHGGDLHQLTRNVMNHIVYLADNFTTALAEIYADQPFKQPMNKPILFALINDTEAAEEEDNGLPAASPSFGESSYSFPGSNNVSDRLAGLLLVLLCKLDNKAVLYKDRALSYLFLANNLRYMIDRVRSSKRLRHLLSREWDASHEHKVQSFLRSFKGLAWDRVSAAIPSDAGTSGADEKGAAGIRQHMNRFNVAFEEACRRQSAWVMLDKEAREDIRTAVTATVVEPYRAFYEKYRTLLRGERDSISADVRFAPEDIASYVAGLYESENYGESGSLHSSGSGYSSPVSPAYSWSGSPLNKTSPSVWRAALRRLTRRRPDTRLWDLGSASPSTSV